MHSQSPNNTIQSDQILKCYLCGEAGENLYENMPDKLFGVFGQWNIKKCKNNNCGLLWVDPAPKKSEVHKIYKDYFTHTTDNNSRNLDSDSHLTQILRSFLWRTTLFSIARFMQKGMFLDNIKPGKLLVVGCGSGRELSIMKSKGWDVVGQEIDEKAAKAAEDYSGCKVYLGELSKILFPDNSFDAITMNHVIEHLYEPDVMLNECYRILNPNGKVVLRTPNADSLGHHYFKSNWRGLEPPRHIHIFSTSTLESLIKKTSFSNFKVITTNANATSIFWAGFDLKNSGKFSFEKPLMSNWYKAIIFKVICTLSILIKARSGEECLLMATKQP